MALMPAAEWLGPVPASNYDAQPSAKIGTVVHVVVGSAASAISEFLAPGSQLSAHFVIYGPGEAKPDGHIVQLVDTSQGCYAQGAGNYPPTAYIGMEFAGDPSFPMSAAQMAAGASIDKWAASVHNFPLIGVVGHGKPGCTTHCNPDGSPDPAWGGHPCPGPIRLAQVPLMIAAAGPPPPLPSGDMAITNDWLIRNCYRTVLHREVDGGGYATWKTFLDGGGDPGEMWAKIQDSAEGVAALAAERNLLKLP